MVVFITIDVLMMNCFVKSTLYISPADTAFCRNMYDKKWYDFDDTTVKCILESKLKVCLITEWVESESCFHC